MRRPALIVAGWTERPAGTRGTMLDPLSPADAVPDDPLSVADRTTDTVRFAAPSGSPAPASAVAAPPEMTLHSLVNPPLVALGVAVLFLLALLVAVMIGSDSDTESADEAGAAFPTHAEAGADERTG